MALSVVDCKRALVMMKLETAGILHGIEDSSQAGSRLDLFMDLWNVEHAWEGFCTWVQRTQDKSKWLIVKKLKPRPVEEVASCTQAVVSRAIRNLLELLKECEILDSDGKLLDGEQLFATDEKGLSQRSDAITAGVIARHQSGCASQASASMGWEHIALTSFVPVSARRQESLKEWRSFVCKFVS